MAVIHAKYLFLSCPKTGSTAVYELLCDFYGGTPIARTHSYMFGAAVPNWWPWQVYPPILDELRGSRKVLTSVRDPKTFYESYYRARVDPVRGGWNPHWGPDKIVCSVFDMKSSPLRKVPFNEFIEVTLDQLPGFATQLFELYAHNADYVLAQEDLLPGLADVLDELGLDGSRARGLKWRRNVSPPTDEPIVWDSQLLTRMKKVETRAYDIWNEAIRLRSRPGKVQHIPH